jgi:DNA polymerase-3 subunit epsilon
MDIEQLATVLAAHPDYKVLRRLKYRTEFSAAPCGALAKGVVIDTETTGLDSARDKIIEVGVVAFEFDPLSGAPIRIMESYGGLDDPGMALSAETTRLTGITDAMVAGQRLDELRVTRLVADAQIVIAHNAAFDRPFLERRLPLFASLPWGCSLMDIDWEGEQLGSRKLDYIAYRMGFFYEAHRAEEDCQALLEILSHPLPISGKPGLKPILERLSDTGYVVFAVNAAFDTKDLLKARQYRWDAVQKVWYRTITGELALEEEKVWLKQAIYGGRAVSIGIEERGARVRFSAQPVPRIHCSL